MWTMRRDSRRAADDASRHGVSGPAALERHDSASAGTGLPVESLTALALEPRLLLDAAAAATGAEAAQQDDDGAAAGPDNGGSSAPKDAGDAAPGDAAAARALAELGENGGRNEIVFVDTSVQDWRTLVDGVDPSAEVVLIDSNDNGLDKMADTLAGRGGIDAVHVISHGDVGEVQLGDVRLGTDNLQDYAQQLGIIGGALSGDGDILLYGCRVALDEGGQAFVDNFADLTQADVAASGDDTGNADFGGDWDLEFDSGQVEARGLFSEDVEGFSGILNTPSLGAATEVATGTDLRFTGGDMNASGQGAQLLIDNADGNVIFHTLDVNGIQSTDSSLTNATAVEGDVAVAPDGSILAVWKSTVIKGQFFNADGSKNGSTFDISGDANDKRPRVTADDSGNFTVLYGDNSNGDVLAKKYNSSGVEINGEIKLSSSAADTGKKFDIDFGGGKYVATWTRNSDDASLARVIDGTHTAQGAGPLVIDGTVTNIGVSVDLNSNGEGAVSYVDNATGNYFYQRVSASGSGSTVGAQVSIGTAVAIPNSIELFDDGSLAVTFENGSGVALSEFDNADTETRSGTDLGPDTSTQGLFGRDDNGNFIVSFSDGSTGNVSIQAFGSANDPPVADLNGGGGGQDFATTFSESTDQGSTGSDGVLIASSPSISDPDGDTIQQIVVTLDNGQGNTGERIFLSGSFTNVNFSLDSATQITITNAGGATPAQMAAALAAVRYQNNDEAPDTTARTITTQVSDANGSSTSTTTVTVDSAPDITQVAVADGTYGIGDDIDVTVTFDGNVTVDTAGGTPSIDLVIDGNTRQADFVSVAGADATFRYTVADGDTGAGNDTDGVDVAANSLALNGGTIEDADGDAADLSHAAANDGGETVDAHIVAPAVTTPISGDDVVNAGEAGSISVSVTGAEAGATVNLSISSSGGGGPVTAMGAADGSGDITFNAVDLGPLTDGTLTIAATQTDGAGNTSTAATAMAQLDTAAPTVGTPDIVAGSDTGVSNSDDLTSDTTPSIDVSASDTLSGVPDGTTVAIDVDLDNDGNFSDPGEAGYATGTLTGGAVTIDLPALADGSYRARARVSDVAGNEGTSGVLTFDVDSTDPVLNGSLSLFENEGPGDTAGTVGLTDASNTTFALTDDAAGRFQIDANTGAVTVTAGTSFDAETEASIPITVQATDDAGNSATQVFNIAIDNVNEAPVIGGVAGETSNIVAGSGATAVSGLGDATLADVDSADFSGGTLTIAQNAGTANGSWGLDGTTATSGGDGTMAAGETVSVGGTAIGTVNAVNDGQGGNTLTLDLGANATPARLQTLLQAMTYDAPSGLGTRDFTLTVVDNDGTANGGDEDASAAFSIGVMPNPPVLSGLDGDSRAYAEGAAAVLLDSGGDAAISDVDSADFDGGALTVSITAGGAAAEDVLEIVDNGAISVTGSEVFFDPGGGPVKIGDIAGGTGGADLVVTLNANAKPGDGSADALLRAIAYRNTDGDSPTTGTRTVEVTVSDAAAGSNPATSAVSTVSVDVTAVNDAPTLAGGPFDLGTTDEDTTTGGTAVSAILAGLTAGDVDAGASSGIAVVASAGNGTWQFSTDGGTSWSDLGAVSDANARLLDTTAQLRYVPDGENGETATLDLRAWDQTAGAVGGVADASSNGGTTAFSTGTATASLTVDAVNDAPTLAGGPFDLGTTDEDTTTGGTAVSAILAGLTAGDVDAGASSGIAVVASTGNGTWQFSTDGGTSWSDLGAVSDANARLLDTAAQLRYLPDGENGETATLDLRAWDQTAGAAGGVTDASSNGGSTAFSTGTATASLTVDAVNDAPTTTGATTLNIAEDGTVTLTTADFNFTDIDAGDALNGVRIDVAPSDGTLFVDGNGDGSVGAGETLTAGSIVAQADIDAGRLRYRPDANFNGSDSLAFTVRDSGGAFAAAQTGLTIQVAAVNDAPTVEGRLADRTAAIGEELSFQLPAGTFDDVEDGGALTLSASRADGSALPGWLGFDAATRTFSGEPGDGDTGSFQVRVTAEDSGGATASTTFAVTVESATTAPPAIEVLNRGPVRIALVETAEGTAQVAFAENVSGNGIEAVLGSLNHGNSPLARSFAESASESGPANEVFEAALDDPRTSQVLQRLAGEADQALIYEDGAWQPLDLETLLGLGGEDAGGGQAAAEPAEDGGLARTAAGADTGGRGDAASESRSDQVAAERAASRAHWIDLAAAALADGGNGLAGGDAELVETAGFSRQVAQRAATFDRDAAALAAALTGNAGIGVRG